MGAQGSADVKAEGGLHRKEGAVVAGSGYTKKTWPEGLVSGLGHKGWLPRIRRPGPSSM